LVHCLGVATTGTRGPRERGPEKVLRGIRWSKDKKRGGTGPAPTDRQHGRHPGTEAKPRNHDHNPNGAEPPPPP
jgi:hypothetical protein